MMNTEKNSTEKNSTENAAINAPAANPTNAANTSTSNTTETPTELTALNVLGSVFRAWFGVQSEENRQRDFSSKDPMPFIIAGVIFTLLIVIGVIVAVKTALAGVPH